MKRKKRTKAQYLRWYDNPGEIGPGNTAASSGPQVIAFPNGERELWVKHPDYPELGLRVMFAAGPAGLSVDVCPMAGTSKTWDFDNCGSLGGTFCQRPNTEYAAQFAKWYHWDGNGERPKHPYDLGIKP